MIGPEVALEAATAQEAEVATVLEAGAEEEVSEGADAEESLTN